MASMFIRIGRAFEPKTRTSTGKTTFPTMSVNSVNVSTTTPPPAIGPLSGVTVHSARLLLLSSCGAMTNFAGKSVGFVSSTLRL